MKNDKNFYNAKKSNRGTLAVVCLLQGSNGEPICCQQVKGLF